MNVEQSATQFQAGISPGRSRWWDVLAAILLLVALFTAASRLEATEWSKDLSIVPYVAIFGTIAGLALGQSRFNAKIAALFGFIYGIFFVAWQLGTLVNETLPWKEKSLELANRVNHVLAQMANRQSVTDSFLFIVLMAILFWILSFVAGYTLIRHGNAWWAILPTGFTIFTIHSFDPLLPRRALYLAVFLFFGLVLVARVTYLHNQNRWQETRTYLPPNLSLDFIRFALAAVTLVVLVSWTVPAVAKSVPAVVEASQPLRNSWQNLRHRWENAFASLRSSVSVYSDYYGNNIALGQGNLLSDTPVFVVTPPRAIPSGIRYYWRALTYNNYDNGQWTDTAFDVINFNPKQDLFKIPNFNGRWQGTFEFTPATYVSTLFSPSQPFWVSPNSRVHLAQNSDDTVDIAGFRANNLIRPEQTYQVQASITNATISQLRAAGTDYPEWVKDRYLQVPQSITPRTLKLAADITSFTDNPYDKVMAITTYLRENIHYTQTIPAVPNGREPLDWFLFDLREGFCNYYASAEVVMLRSIGIPARWAIGYAQGERQSDGRYLIRQSDAHSWPEVFFPGLGWVEFEPTVAQPDINRIAGSAVDTSGAPTNEQELALIRQEELDALRLRNEQISTSGSTPIRTVALTFIPWLAAVGLIVVSGLLVWKNRKRIHLPSVPIIIETALLRLGIQPPQKIHRWAIRAALPPLSKSYLEINLALTRLGEPPRPTQTPAERADHLGAILPPAQEPARRLLEEYQIATFSEQNADYKSARAAGLEIRKLSINAFLLNLIKSIQRIFQGRRTVTNPRLTR